MKLLAKRGVYVKEACDKCGQLLGAVRYTRRGEPGEWCSRECRGDAKAESETRRRRRTRHYKNCKQCGTRFLAKRSDQEFCKVKCRVRWNRSHGPSDSRVTDNCQPPSGTRASFGENDGVFIV